MDKKKLEVLKKDLQDGSSHFLDYLLSDNVSDTISLSGIRIRKVFSPLLRFVYGFQSEYKFVLDKREKLKRTNKGKIFIVNHRQGDDMVFSAMAAGKSGYFVFGNPILACEKFTNGFGLGAYGMIITKRDDKNSRKATTEKMRYVLENKGNIIIFAEGYWNLDDDGLSDDRHMADDHNSESWLIQDLNIGPLRLAQELGCDVVPVILHYDESNNMKCYARRGSAFRISKEDDVFVKKDEFKDIMNTMYYELMQKYSYHKRSDLESCGLTLKEQWELLKARLVAGCDIDRIGYKLDLRDEKRIGKAKVVKGVTVNEEAFEHLKYVNYDRSNAYLLSKKLTGIRR